jgi:8-oxo-dGTP diphosphatase
LIRHIGKPEFSCDTGLYFEEVSEEEQPEIRIKRIKGKSLTYREMLNYYSNLAEKYGGRLTAYYKNAICLVIDEDTIHTYDGKDIWSERFYIVDQPHKKYNEGFPLDSLSVEIRSNRYYYDIEDEEPKTLVADEGFREFFKRSIGVESRDNNK